MTRLCSNRNCTRTAREDFRWCDSCTATVLRTGRPPELPAFVAPWRRNLQAKELRDVA